MISYRERSLILFTRENLQGARSKYLSSNEQLGKLGTVKPLSHSKAIISKRHILAFFPSLKIRPTSDFGIFMSARTFCTTFGVPVLPFVRADFTAVTPFTPANPVNRFTPVTTDHPSPKHLNTSTNNPQNVPKTPHAPQKVPKPPQNIPESFKSTPKSP